MRTWIHSPLAVLTPDDDPCAGLVVNEGFIESVLGPGEAPNVEIDLQFDASGLVLLPGLVNTHHHDYQTLTRALASQLVAA